MFDGASGGRELNFEGDIKEFGKGGNGSEIDIFDEAKGDYISVEVGIDDLFKSSKELLFTMRVCSWQALVAERRAWEIGGPPCATGIGSNGSWEYGVVEEWG